MRISINQVAKYSVAAILFAVFIVNVYYTSAGNNKFSEPADVILSVFTPIILIAAATYTLNRGDKKIYLRLIYIAIFTLIFTGGLYLSRNYWYKLGTFWSFTLSVVLPGVLMLALLASPLAKSIFSKHK